MVNPALPEVQAALAAVRSELAAVQAERPDMTTHAAAREARRRCGAVIERALVASSMAAAIEATPNVPPRGVWSSRWRGA